MDTFEEIRENLRQTAALLAKNAKESAAWQVEERERRTRHENEMAKWREQNEKEIAELRKKNEADIAEIAELRKKNEAEAAERRAEDRERWARQDKETAEMKKTLKSVGRQLGGIGMNNGAYFEEIVYTSLCDKLMIGGERYDIIERNMPDGWGSTEFDILMHNGVASVIIEVKYRAHLNDIPRLLSKKPAAFRRTYPQYNRHHKLYLGIASGSIYDKLREEAKEAQIFLLGPKGDSYEVVNEKVQAF